MRKCQCCGVALPLGSLFYQCQVEFVSGYDEEQPYLGAAGEDENEDINSLVSRLCEQDEEQVMAEVYEKMEFVLCASCRLQLASKMKRWLTGGDKVKKQSDCH